MKIMMAMLLVQFVVSVKAGLVNHVQGTANVAEMEMARAQRPIRTGTDGYAEILLSPGSFLRLGEDSEAIINDADLSHVVVTLTRGPAVIEVIEISKFAPLTITTGNLTTKIVSDGIYRFADGVATVIQGKLQTEDGKLTYEKGWQVFFQDSYRARKTSKIPVNGLDVYSEARSAVNARINMSLAAAMQGPVDSGIYDFWLYSSEYDSYSFIPRGIFRSPYGHKYYGANEGRVARQGGNYSNNSSSGGGGGTSPGSIPAPPRDTSNNNNSGGGGGGSSAPPAPTASTPSGQTTTPAVYIESKSTPVGATQ
jgi:hypothetical protein